MTNSIEASRMMSVADIAYRLNCSARTVWRLRDRGLMPQPIKLGKLIRWKAETIERWIAEDCPVPQATPASKWKR